MATGPVLSSPAAAGLTSSQPTEADNTGCPMCAHQRRCRFSVRISLVIVATAHRPRCNGVDWNVSGRDHRFRRQGRRSRAPLGTSRSAAHCNLSHYTQLHGWEQATFSILGTYPPVRAQCSEAAVPFCGYKDILAAATRSHCALWHPTGLLQHHHKQRAPHQDVLANYFSPFMPTWVTRSAAHPFCTSRSR